MDIPPIKPRREKKFSRDVVSVDLRNSWKQKAAQEYVAKPLKTSEIFTDKFCGCLRHSYSTTYNRLYDKICFQLVIMPINELIFIVKHRVTAVYWCPLSEHWT